jgi:hydrogenase large subunit
MSKTVYMPMNRVEGDLEVKVVIEDHVVTDAWMIGTMFRGVENMLIGRGVLDGLVITPRICGICSTSHLLAAAMALENIAGVFVGHNSRMIRSIVLGAEKLQSDLRHIFLMFAADLANPGYAQNSLHAEAVRRYQPFKGSTVVSTILATRKIPEITAILGGQWPHTSFIVPGGITSQPSEADLRQCRMLLSEFRRWYEQTVLGCSLERIATIKSCDELAGWLDENQTHRNSELGFFLRCGSAFGLDRIGKGHEAYLVAPNGIDGIEQGEAGGGFLHDGVIELFDQERIGEQVKYAKYQTRSSGGHPLTSATLPAGSMDNDHKYSWCKAPRYSGTPVETGPLAEALVRRDPLFLDMVACEGASALSRELARLLRPGRLLLQMEQCLLAIDPNQKYYHPADIPEFGTGVGLLQAPRGMLGHWVRISEGLIDLYQVITPTTWNASPRDDQNVRGPIEEALLGTPVRNPEEPVEVGHVVRSFDLCMVCSVHAVSKKGSALGNLRVGT